MMLRVELLIIGNEILSGHTLDTNSQWLAQRLLELSLPVQQMQVIEDNIEVIVNAIRACLERQTTLLITTGGLGPTFDDLTAKGLALALEAPLELHPQALAMVTDRYNTLKRQGLVESSAISSARKKMANLPHGAEPLPNSVGTAPGIHIQQNTTHIYCLPGVPQELYAIFMEAVAPRIALLTKKVVVQRTIQVPILDESVLAPLLDKVLASSQDVYLKSLPRPYQSRLPLRVSVTATASTKTQAKSQLLATINTLQELAKRNRQTQLQLDD
ncbi:MAG: competence/damage-inducible protein A [Promethearchaeota archaeon]